MSYANLLLFSAIAGFTIFLGLPAAMLAARPRMRSLMSALSAGVLIFLFIEIAHKCLELVEEEAKGALSGAAGAAPLFHAALLVAGFTTGLLGLALCEELLTGQAGNSGPALRSKRISLMIAVGIGLHNFGEGLAIGQEWANGALSLAYILIAGFALHNATEGFGIAAPLQTEKVDWKFLGLLGFIGGGPTVAGALIGSTYALPSLELLALALAAGSILYVIGELLHIGRALEQRRTALAGLLIGFFTAYGSEMAIELGMVSEANRMTVSSTFSVEMGEYHFLPNRFSVDAGEPVRFFIHNTGKETHEFELPGLGIEAVVASGDSATLTIPKTLAGNYKVICDLPGHAAKGMTGELLVRE